MRVYEVINSLAIEKQQLQEVCLLLAMKPFSSPLNSVSDEDFARIKKFYVENRLVLAELAHRRNEEKRLEDFRRSPAGFLDGVLVRARSSDWTITKRWRSSTESMYFELERDDLSRGFLKKSLRFSNHTTSVFDGIDVSIVVSSTTVREWDPEPDCLPRVKRIKIFTSVMECRHFTENQLPLAQDYVVESLNSG